MEAMELDSMVECYTDPEMEQMQHDYDYKEFFIDGNIDAYDHVTKVIRYHPKYFEHYIKTHRYLMYDDGPLPFPTRHYLAIIAAARNKCNYLVNLHEKDFIAEGGDITWLKGLEFIPQKLCAIYDINKILAHRPWLLTKEHIEGLTKGSNSWSLAEVVHAIVILAHFHSLSSFVFSCGLNQELDASLKNGSSVESETPLGTDDLETESDIKPSTTPPFIQRLKMEQQRIHHQHHQKMKEQEENRKILQMKNSNVASCNASNAAASDNIDMLMKRMQDLSEKKKECSEAELNNRFKNVELQAAQLATSSSQSIINDVPPSISHYVDDPNYTYQDFARRGAENIPHTFRIQDYSWDDHGYSLVNRLYNDVGFLLDDKFRVAYNLTYKTLAGRQNVDTSKFRRAIWNYIQCIYGIRHDDYDYGEVNKLLDRPLKTFIKTACCYPDRITKQDYDSILVELLDSEKVHVNLMILEAKNQAILLYALRELNR
ncbi:CLUMA_CG013347, isoform A [Clunio marinus]|uniref:CLUMA_CG013347, isoform A n=1 Tax=Clunio marinus TaxID=568069 RepID=A0A1J1IIK2_9DIPT|nr:CLUMA_CG013347, isoform A [Clunio marinus]